MNEVLFSECITTIEIWMLTFSVFSFIGSCIAVGIVWRDHLEHLKEHKIKSKAKNKGSK